ncbi:MAG: CsbD family protein [Gaiellaceae bacterium]
MGDRMQRVKGKANEAAGKAKANTGYATGSGKTEAKGVGKALKGKAQQATGKARSSAKKATR